MRKKNLSAGKKKTFFFPSVWKKMNDKRNLICRNVMLLSQFRGETSSSIPFFLRKTKSDLRICWLTHSYGVVAMLWPLQRKRNKFQFKDCWFQLPLIAMLCDHVKRNKFRSEDCWLTRPLWRGRHVVIAWNKTPNLSWSFIKSLARV
jgi:hypothetical protein